MRDSIDKTTKEVMQLIDTVKDRTQLESEIELAFSGFQDDLI